MNEHLVTAFKGISIGFSIAAPVGPIGVLCIRRSIADGRWIGFLCGLGAAVADALYGAVAAFGLTLISDALKSQQLWLQVIGGLFLCHLGLKTFRSSPATEAAVVRTREGYLGAFASTLFLTITNPMTIVAFVGIFTGTGLATESANRVQATLLVTGVFVGSAAWWLILSGGAAALRERVTTEWMRLLNRASGLFIGGFGFWQLAKLLL